MPRAICLPTLPGWGSEVDQEKKPAVVLVGRTNVGKSSLFNRLTETAKSLVSPLPGTTRDRNTAEVIWRGKTWTLIDTGGLEGRTSTDMESAIERQVEIALSRADAILLVVDGQSDVLPQDRLLAQRLRRAPQPKFLVVNKIDSQRHRVEVSPDFGRLGFSQIHQVSARNGNGTGDLLDAVDHVLPEETSIAGISERPIRLSFIGKPNVGKSSIINALVNEERSIVSPEPYTTRDPLDIEFRYRDRHFVIVDTAGLRKQSRIRAASGMQGQFERQSTTQTLRMIGHSDIVAIVLDVSEPVSSQDRRLSAKVVDEGKGLLFILNKSDLIQADQRTRILKEARERLTGTEWAPVLLVSAATGAGLRNILKTVIRTHAEGYKRIDNDELSRMMAVLLGAQRPPLKTAKQGKRVKLKLEQVSVNPPTFSLSANIPGNLPQAYLRFVENQLRREYGFEGTPVKIFFKPYRGRV
ncbi:MAG: ribosome biogenesis GTPase Der [bacterium]|nr:ribosome biogenesis GTPase Der [bacterium]